MKILLINPATWLEEFAVYRRIILPPIPPLSLAYLAAIAEGKGHATDIHDQFLHRTSNEELARRAVAEGYDLVGITCLVLADKMVRDLTRRLREQGFTGKIVLGNTHASTLAESFLDEGTVDFIVHGEGESSFAELLDALDGAGDFAAIRGLSYRDGDTLCHTETREPASLKGMPLPAWNKFDLSRYNLHPMLFSYRPTVPIQGSRGCPYHCFMCVQDAMMKRFRVRPVGEVVDEIVQVIDRYGVHDFGFLDTIFPPNKKWGWEFVEQVRARVAPRPFSYYIETRTDLVDPELFPALVEIGARNIMVGFESSSDESLEKMGKNTTAAQGREAMAVLRKTGVATTGFFMIGFPWETEAMVADTVRYALDLAPDILKFNIVTPLPGSKFYEDLEDKTKVDFSLLTPWTDLSGGPPPQTFAALPVRTLLKYQRNGMMRHFSRPKILWRHLLLGTFRLRTIPFMFLLARNMLIGRFKHWLGR